MDGPCEFFLEEKEDPRYNEIKKQANELAENLYQIITKEVNMSLLDTHINVEELSVSLDDLVSEEETTNEAPAPEPAKEESHSTDIASPPDEVVEETHVEEEVKAEEPAVQPESRKCSCGNEVDETIKTVINVLYTIRGAEVSSSTKAKLAQVACEAFAEVFSDL